MGFKLLSRYLSLILILSFASIGSNAQAPHLLADSTQLYRLDESVEVFIDSTNHLSIEDVSASHFQKNFTSRGNLVFGYQKQNIWLKVTTKASRPHTNWYLEIPAPFLEYVDFYQALNGRWKTSLAGYYRKQSDRDISHTSHVIKLLFGADSTNTTFIKIAGQSPKTFPLYAVEKEKFTNAVRYTDVGYGVFFGILFVMFFYNFFIYLTLRQTNYLLYICTIVCSFFIFAAASGYAGKFIWPEHPSLNFYTGRLPLGLLCIFLSYFTIRFLEVKKYSRVMYYVLLTLMPLAVIAMILVATQTLSSAGNNLISLSTIIYMTTGIVCRIKGNRTADYFIAAWTTYFVGGLLLTLRNSGVFDFNFWTTHFVEIGAILETTLIAFALADRYRRIRLEKEEAQTLTLKLQQQANEALEMKVAQRTEELLQINTELHATLETNREQTKVIEDKNAELDSFFYRISHDLKGPISSLLGLANLAKQEVKDKEALQYITRQQLQIERLNTIVGGLIDLTKLNQNEVKNEPIDFDKLVDDCIASFDGFENFSRVAFKKEIQTGIYFESVWSLANAIVQNLIENAIKYAGTTSPFVHIRVRQDKTHLLLVVEDNGQGIPAEHQSKIFEMFFRASHHGSGTGLGLYILKRSVDRLGGKIEMQSEVGKGSKFSVTLPTLNETPPRSNS